MNWQELEEQEVMYLTLVQKMEEDNFFQSPSSKDYL